MGQGREWEPSQSAGGGGSIWPRGKAGCGVFAKRVSLETEMVGLENRLAKTTPGTREGIQEIVKSIRPQDAKDGSLYPLESSI